jgi:hypothetical protein
LPRSINRDVPVVLETMVMRALATDPQKRHPNARAFADELDRWLESRETRFGLSHPLASAAVGALLTFLLCWAGLRVSSPPASAASAAAISQGEVAATNGGDASEDGARGPFYQVGNGTAYHVQKCSHVKGIAPEKLKELTLSRAVERGLKPCGTCNPPSRPLAMK